MDILDVNSHTLLMAKLKFIEVRSSASDKDIFNFLHCLQTDDCVHSWNNISMTSAQGALEKLNNYENRIRDTQMFFYYGHTYHNTVEIIAAGCIAHKISHNYKYEGYPVIARCFIRPEFRNLRLYFPILQHRFEYCISLYGKRLKGIHMGTQNPRVFNVVQNNRFGISFCYLGDEYLNQKGSNERVHDYLWFSNKLKRELSELRTGSAQKCGALDKLNNLILQMISNKFTSSSFSSLLSAISDVDLALGESVLNANTGLSEVVDLLRAIPVIEETESHELLLPSTLRKAA
ncbi:MAG: hypothetical protein H7061_14735 [Bdellovibrionaceae bacterium]|nr:hypothetical protein [Bdellovibrio sp.]